MGVKFLYVTAGSAEEAQRVGGALVEERLAACANVFDGMRSIYWWQGRVQQDNEAVLILKTTDDRLAAAIDRVKALHSYDVPCVVALSVEAGNPDYLNWIADETSSAPQA